MDGTGQQVHALPGYPDALFASAPVAMAMVQVLYNEMGVVVDCVLVQTNSAFVQLVGNGLEKGQRLSMLLSIPELSEALTHLQRTGTPFAQEVLCQLNGVPYSLQASFSRLDPERLLAAFTDITVYKQNNRDSQYYSHLQTFFDTANAGMYTLRPIRDEQGEITDFRFGLVNQAVASYLGLQAEELAGTLGSLYFPAYKTNGLFDRYVATMRTGTPSTFDIHYADGYDNFFTIKVMKVGDELFGTFTDHSPLKRLQRDLEGLIGELKRSNTSLEQFAHAASHDLQEPLRKIMLYATRLEEGYGDDLNDEAFGYLERIQTAGKRMQRLIRDLLVFAEVGARGADFGPVALTPLVQEVINDMEVAIAERDASIAVGDLGVIHGDSLHLQQLFQNLISNALKYSRSGVRPHISIAAYVIKGKDAGIEMSAAEQSREYLRIVVRDNGQGFTNDQATQIFKIFQRLPQHRLECAGTGIGLAIVQRVVENHKGYIKAEGVPGEGATFTVLLPGPVG